MSSQGEMLRAWKGSDDFTTLRNVKSGSIEEMLNQLYTADNQRSMGNYNTLRDFQNKWQAGQGQYANQANQEIGSLDQFYNGGMEAKLSGIRQARRKAYTDSTARAVADINRNRSIGFLGGDTPNNSYGNRQALRQASDAEIALGLDDVNQQRSDLNYLTGNQINLAGRRGGIQDSVLQRLLVPMQLNNAELARREGNLANLSNIDKSNTFYGLQKHRTWMDQEADAENAFGQTIMDAASVYGSISGGGGGGGGGSKVRSGGSGPTWDSGTNFGGGGAGSGGTGYIQMNGQNAPYSASPGIDYNPRYGSQFGGLA